MGGGGMPGGIPCIMGDIPGPGGIIPPMGIIPGGIPCMPGGIRGIMGGTPAIIRGISGWR